LGAGVVLVLVLVGSGMVGAILYIFLGFGRRILFIPFPPPEQI
jgi:hypothetical protein